MRKYITPENTETTHFSSSFPFGADGQNRTGDLCVTSAVLYQLSYIGTTPLPVGTGTRTWSR